MLMLSASKKMNSSQLWYELHDLFDTDDGSLPEIWLTHLTGSEVASIYLFLLSRGKDVPLYRTTFWDKQLQQARALDSVQNAAMLVVQGRAEPFHLLIGGLTLHEIIIPDLGIFVWDDSLYIDYRMGSEWGPAELGALFECLYHINKIAPEMQVVLEDGVIEQVQKRFRQVWQHYLHAAAT
jgi:hypothetical protein